jgi:hypothetical protein
MHRSLWCARVFIHEEVDDAQGEEILVYIARELGIPWEELRPRLGADTYEWPFNLAVERLTKGYEGPDDETARMLDQLSPSRYGRGGAAPVEISEATTFKILEANVRPLVKQLERSQKPKR